MKTLIRILPALFAQLAAVAPLSAATVPEPSTVIYGKVLHRAFGNEHRLTEGTLVWTLGDASGRTHTFTTELEDIKGVLSYRINIPHQAFASGLQVDPSVIPLRPGETRYDFLSIQVNGSPARILWSADEYLKTLQRARAATHRIDLEVFFDLADTDGDGMPDWWEISHGLDWQVPNANLDSDGDGWSNFHEYRNGTNPKVDDRKPSLDTTELAAYGESNNGVWLRAIDANTPPSGLTFTLTRLPAGGELHFDGGGSSTTKLNVGSTFTQEQVSQGRVLYLHQETDAKETSFGVSLSDGTNEPHLADVAINIFPPDSPPQANAISAPEWWRDENAVFEAYWGMRENILNGQFVESVLLYYLGKNHGWTLWDQRNQTLPVALTAAGSGSHFLLGGDADDTLAGSNQDDILSGGRGTNRLRGNGGKDLFIISSSLDIIADFNAAEDVLDLGPFVVGKTGSLNAYLQASYNGTHTEVRLNQSGTGTTFSDAVVRLENVQLNQDDLNRLWSRGQLLLGNIQGLASVSITGWPASSLEEGFSTAELVVRRDGPVNQPLSVTLSISGNATNGVDYTAIPTSVSFAAGKREVTLSINPLLDNLNEISEQLHLSVVSGNGYVLGEAATGIIHILDAKQRFNIVPVDAYAVANDEPGFLQIIRTGPSIGAVELLLQTSGDAVRDVDYKRISTPVSFADNQKSRLISIEALSLGLLATPETNRTLTVSIRPSITSEYLLGNTPSASIRLLSELQTFEQWAADENLIASGEVTSEMLDMTSPRSGLTALLEYAFSYRVNLADGVQPVDRELINPRLIRDANGMCFEFSKRLNDPRLVYTIERSADLKNWVSDPELFTEETLSAAQRNAGRVRYRVVEPETGALPYMRVRVNRGN
jgi:hypothetical protein